MMSIDERLDKAEEMIQKPSFRENKGLGNEVGYYIFDYPAEKEMYIRERIEYIKKKSENLNDELKAYKTLENLKNVGAISMVFSYQDLDDDIKSIKNEVPKSLQDDVKAEDIRYHGNIFEKY